MATMDPWRPDLHAKYAPAGPKVASTTPKLRVRVIFVPWPKDSPESKEWKAKSEQWNTVRVDKYKIIYWDSAVTDDPVLSLANRIVDSQIYIRGHGSPGAPAIVTKVDDKDIPLPIEEACDRLVGMGLRPSFAGAIKFHFCYSGTIFASENIDAKEEKATAAVERTKQLLANLEEERKQADATATKYAKMNIFQRIGGGKKKRDAAIAKRDSTANQILAGQPFLRNQQLKVPTRESLATKGANRMRALGFTQCRYYGYLGPVESEFGSLDTDPTGPNDYHKFVNLEALRDAPLGLAAGAARVRASVARVRIR